METNRTRSPIADAQLDRLVDGALTSPERRELLIRLETEPDGWRRCALAFLQAQAWREALGPIASPEDAHDVPPVEGAGRPRLWPRVVPMTLAAGLVVGAFLLGRSTGSGDLQPSDQGRLTTSVASRDGRLADPDDPASRIPEDGPAVAGLGAEEVPIDPPPWPEEVEAIGYVSLPTDVGPDSPIVQLPVLSGPGLDDRWLRDQPSFVPEELRQGWERSGYDVESQRRLVSVQLDDSGRYVTIPVDEVRLRGSPRATY